MDKKMDKNWLIQDTIFDFKIFTISGVKAPLGEKWHISDGEKTN